MEHVCVSVKCEQLSMRSEAAGFPSLAKKVRMRSMPRCACAHPTAGGRHSWVQPSQKLLSLFRICSRPDYFHGSETTLLDMTSSKICFQMACIIFFLMEMDTSGIGWIVKLQTCDVTASHQISRLSPFLRIGLENIGKFRQSIWNCIPVKLGSYALVETA